MTGRRFLKASLLFCFAAINIAAVPSLPPDFFDVAPSVNRLRFGWPFWVVEVDLLDPNEGQLKSIHNLFVWPSRSSHIRVVYSSGMLNVVTAAIVVLCADYAMPILRNSRVSALAGVAAFAIVVGTSTAQVNGGFANYAEIGWPVGFIRRYGDSRLMQYAIWDSLVIFLADLLISFSVICAVMQVVRRHVCFGLRTLFLAIFFFALTLGYASQLATRCASERALVKLLDPEGSGVFLERNFTPVFLQRLIPHRVQSHFYGISSIWIQKPLIGALSDVQDRFHNVTTLSSNQPEGLELLRRCSQCNLMIVDLSNCDCTDADDQIIRSMPNLRYGRWTVRGRRHEVHTSQVDPKK